jgi:N6-L-threonylcarbamoyladenine synthase
MLILSIETSCDETAISLVEAKGDFPNATYEILGNAIWSQIDIHREYGGVVSGFGQPGAPPPTIVPMLEKALTESEHGSQEFVPTLDSDTEEKVRRLLEREIGLADQLLTFHREYGKVTVDLIAVTSGPGLEPALWVGVNFAKALALLWDTPIIPVNHMEGHVLAGVFDVERDDQLSDIEFPTVSLLISGGHTELILMSGWGQYEKVGQTRDDAAGEAFDKVARLIGLPYPGGPEISKRAAEARKRKLPQFAKLPTPMLHSGDLNFSFSGLKTAVRYAVQDKELSPDDILAVARDFEDAVTTVLVKKSFDAIEKYDAKNLIVGGGVSANRHIRHVMEATVLTEHPEVTVYFPSFGLSTDNSIMIALAGHARAGRPG